MYPILDCVSQLVTLVSPIVCMPEGYKDLQERISRGSRNQSLYDKKIITGNTQSYLTL